METKINLQVNGRIEAVINSDYFYISGWCFSKRSSNYNAILGGRPILLHRIIRKDLPPDKTFSFVAYGRAIDYVVGGHDEVLFQLMDGKSNKEVSRQMIKSGAAIKKRIPNLVEKIEKKNAWIEKYMKGSGYIVSENGAFDFLTGKEAHNPSLKYKTDGISAHPHHKQMLDLVSQMPPGGMALDVGCGFKANLHEKIVGLEIFDYPGVNVLSFAQGIPFEDDSFDIVYSNAVLEHVDDPFLCAKEMIRVLKPGGKLMSCIPFLQAEHGYPHHFFNATRAGHAKLFEDGIDIEQQYVGEASQPWYIVMRSLMLYRSFLPTQGLKEDFEKLTIKDILSVPYNEWLSHELVMAFPEEKKWILAGATTLLGSKKQEGVVD